MEIVPVVAILSVFGSIAFLGYLWLTSRHKERMALIENNRDASIFFAARPLPGSSSLKMGLALAFGGAGLLIGYLVAWANGLPEELGVFSFLFMMSGLGLILFYVINARRLKE